MTSTATPQQMNSSSSLTWELVHAEPGALVFAVPGLKPTHPLVGRTARQAGAWVPRGTPTVHDEPIQHPALHYAGFIGRVGVLAAALGVGAALAGQQPGIAWAEPTDTDAGAATSSSPVEPGSTTQTPPSSESSAATSAPTSTVSSSGGAQTSDTATDTTAQTSTSSPSQTSTTVSAPGSTSPEVTISSSGGAQTSTATTDADTSASAETATPTQTAPTESAPQPPVEETLAAAPAPVQAAPETTPTADTVETPSATTSVATEPGSHHATAPETAPTATTPTLGPSTAATQTPAAAITESTTGVTATNGQPSSTTAESAQPTTAAAPVTPAPVGLISRLVNTVLAPFSPATTTPAAAQAAQAPVLWGVFAWVRRTFFNTTPTVAYDPTQTTQLDNTFTPVNAAPIPATPAFTLDAPEPGTGAVEGALHVTDPDLDVLTYTVAGGPTGGTVALRPDATFTYTPTPEARRIAADSTVPAPLADNFAVTVDDGHGHVISVPVSITIDPANIGLVVSEPGSNGEVNVSVTVTDPETDPVTYLVVHDPSYGTTAPLTSSGTTTTAAITQPDDTVVATIGVGNHPTQVALSPDGTRAYVTNTTSKSVSVIDTTTNEVVATIGVGNHPQAVAVSPDGTHAYVTNTYSNSVSVIDTDTNTVVKTIRVGWTPTQVTISPDGTHAYVTNTYSKSVSVIDTDPVNVDTYNTVIATVGVGRTPTQVMVSPDGTLAYVTNTGSKSVSVIDTTTNKVVDTIGVGNSPVALAVAPGGTGPAYTDPLPPSEDATTGAVTGSLGWADPDGDPLTFTVTSAPAYGTVTVDSAGTYTYVPNQAGRIRAGLGIGNEDSFTVNITQPGATQGTQIYVVNANSNTVSIIGAQPAPIPQTFKTAAAATEDGISQPVTVQIAPDEFDVGDPIPVTYPYGVTFSPDGTRAYVAGSNIVSVIDTTTNFVIGEPIHVGAQPTRVAFSPDGTRAYVTNNGSDTVSVINTDPTPNNPDYNTVVYTIDLPEGSGPIALAVSSDDSPDGSRIYVANYNRSTLSVIDADTATDTYTVIGDPITVGPGPQGVAVSPDGIHVYVTSTGGGSGGPMMVIDTTTNIPVEIEGVGIGSFGVAFSPHGDRLYVMSGSSWTDPYVAVIDTAVPGSETYNTVIDFIDIDTAALELAVSPDGSLIYVTHPFEDTMSVIAHDAANDTYTVIDMNPATQEIDPLTVGAYPLVVAVDPIDGNHIYVTNDQQQANTVTPISIGSVQPAP